jgi:signal transduction histidine kinase
MDTITIELPTAMLDAAKISAEEAKVALAVQLYKQGKLTLEQAIAFTDNATLVNGMAFESKKPEQLDINEFLSWASHDLKTPLNAVIGFTKVVLKGIDGPINDMQTTDLTTAHNAGQRMLALLSNLVDIARLNSDKISLTREEINICPLITDVATRWKTQNPAKNLQFDNHLASPLIFKADILRMKQILTCILNYTAMHIKDEGNVIFSASGDDREIVLNIKSSGEKARDRSMMDITMLAFICRRLVELHGGNVVLMQDTVDGAQVRIILID